MGKNNISHLSSFLSRTIIILGIISLEGQAKVQAELVVSKADWFISDILT